MRLFSGNTGGYFPSIMDFWFGRVLLGNSKANSLKGDAGAQVILGLGGSDNVDGGAGSDLVLAGDGNDVGTYKRAENIGARDYYDGGSGADTLRIVLTAAEWARADFKADILRYVDFLASNTSQRIFSFSAFDLTVRSFETIELVVDGVVTDPRGGNQNANPVANADAATTEEDAAVTINVLANDTDPNGDALSVTAASAVNGVVTVNADRTITYTPSANYNGTDTITYTIADGSGGVATSTVAVTITAVNDAATISGNSAGTVVEDGVLTASGQLTVADPDAQENSTIAESFVGPYGTLSIGSNGLWTFSLNNAAVQSLGATETLTLTYPARSVDLTATQDIVITIQGANEVGGPPIVTTPPTIPTTLAEDNTVIISGITIDIPGVTDALVNTSVSTPNGVVALTITSGLTFSDADGSDGTIAFSGTEIRRQLRARQLDRVHARSEL